MIKSVQKEFDRISNIGSFFSGLGFFFFVVLDACVSLQVCGHMQYVWTHVEDSSLSISYMETWSLLEPGAHHH